jgi:transposase
LRLATIAERSIKPFVIGRKYRLFANTPKDPRAIAVICSIIETAKENRPNPHAYPNLLFEKLPNLDSKDHEALDPLLPWNVILQWFLKTVCKSSRPAGCAA